MDQKPFLLMLSNLLHLHNHHLDPTSTPQPPEPPPSSPAPLLFFTIASLLSYLSSTKDPENKKRKKPNSKKSAEKPSSPSSKYSISAFRALSTEHIWAMEAPARDAQWTALYGLSYPTFTTVVEALKPYITQSNLSLPSDYAVAMVLSRLAHKLSIKTLAQRYALEPYLISKITNMVTRLLATKLYPEFVRVPVSRSTRIGDNTMGFRDLTGLPNVCGAIDTTPVRIKKNANLENSGSYDCKYGYPSVLLQVVADHKKIFWDVCVKAPGSCDDATHFRDSLLYNKLMSGNVVWDKAVNVRGQPVRPYIIGDWCFPLLSFLITPFGDKTRTGNPVEDAFDDTLMKGRKTVEEAIGMLKGRWKILQELNVGLNHIPQTIVACCVLHNLCQIAREPEPDLWKEPEETGHRPRVLENEKSCCYYGENLRRLLAEDLYQRMSSR